MDDGFRAASRPINLGKTRHIPDAELREIYAKVGGVSTQRKQSTRQRQTLTDDIRKAKNALPSDLGERLWAGESVEDEISADVANVHAMEAELDQVQRRVDVLVRAEAVGVRELDAMLDEKTPDLLKSSLSKAKSLPAKLTMVDKLLAEIYDLHDSTMGLIHMLEARAGGDAQALVVRHIVKTPQVELSLATEHVRNALVKLKAELDVAESLHGSIKGRKRRKPVEPVSEAPVAAEPAQPEDASPTFEIEADEEPDDD